MKLPTEQQCLNYFEEFKVPKNIFDHCQAVKEVSLFLAKELQKKNLHLDLAQLECMAFLHDLFKTVVLSELKTNSFYPNPYSPQEIEMWKFLRQKYAGKHESEAAFLFFQDSFPELGQAIKDSSNSQKKTRTWEEDILHYVDWRILGQEIVSSAQRIKYIEERYFPEKENNSEKFQELQNYLQLFEHAEQRIFSQLDFTPQQLKEEFEKRVIH